MNAEPAGQPTGAETFDFDVLSTGATEPTGLLSVPVSADLWTRQCRITTLDQQKACRPERVGRGNKHFQDVVQLSVYTCRKGGPRCCTKRVEVGKVAGTQHCRPRSDLQNKADMTTSRPAQRSPRTKRQTCFDGEKCGTLQHSVGLERRLA